MFEVPVIAWIAAAVLAVVVAVFCGYEVWWKARRLQADLGRLQSLDERVQALQTEVEATRARIAAAGSATGPTAAAATD